MLCLCANAFALGRDLVVGHQFHRFRTVPLEIERAGGAQHRREVRDFAVDLQRFV